MPEFVGRTADAEAPFLSGAFWQPGVHVRGIVSKIFMDKEQRTCVVLDLENPVVLDGAEWDRVSLGNLSGFLMAAGAAKDEKGKAFDRLRLKDVLEMECEDVKAPTKEGYSPRPNFRIKVSRP